MGVEFARVLPGAKAFKANNRSDTWIGPIYLATGEVLQAVIKDVPQKELANELLGAALCEAVGLPAPRAFLSIASPDVLTATKGPPVTGGRLVFASGLTRAPSLRQFWTGSRIPQAILDALAEWAGCGSAFGFDTWTANVDRNVGNVLFASKTDIWLIDHGQCLSGPAWLLEHLVADKVYDNKMTLWLTPHLNGTQKIRLLRGVEKLAQAIKQLDIDAIVNASKVAALLTLEEAAAMLSFLKARSDHVSLIAARQAGVPGLV